MKRFLDILVSVFGLLLTWPLFLLVACMIRLDSPGPIFFRQKRVGFRGQLFDILKFRTMVEDAQALGPKITAMEDPRVTQIGHVLRWLKLDELPQLANVLKGDMSMVGPRPEVPEIVAHYSEEEKRVLGVLPGIIGVSQISNRDEASLMSHADQDDVEGFYVRQILPDKLKRDLAYIRDKNALKDLKILFGGGVSVFLTSIKLRYILESRRRLVFLLLDLSLAALAFTVSFGLRFDWAIPPEETAMLKNMLPLILILRAPAFIYFGLYQSLWQYLGIQELLAIIKAVAASSLFIPVIPFLLQTDFPPRSILIIDGLLLITFLGGSRVMFKLTAERLRKPGFDSRKNVLIIGAEDAGELLVREFIKRPVLGYKPVGFLDNDPEKVGIRIHGVKVLGRIPQLAQVIRVRKADEVIIALPQSSGEEIKGIIRECQNLKLPCRIVPQASAMMAPAILPLRLRPIDVSDLLGRELFEADLPGIQNFFRGKRVLITGAGGSIGSELARIVFQSHPSELILVDVSENNLYDIETDLAGKPTETGVVCYLRDVTLKADMEQIIKRHRPQVIYHAAAYKHVPLLEAHYAKGILNNVLGTKVMADLSVQCGVDCFVLVSTDKAINPSSIMGATKRIAELYTQSLKSARTRFLAVRFGNVFNSKGSVVPLFRKQIEAGGPVTITHPEVTRYFMDISEAVFLILQATVLGSDSEIFVLEMGEAIKVEKLARDLIQLMGLSEKQISIHYIGLRPGEKLHEELELDGEKSVATAHKKIRIWKSSKTSLPSDLHVRVEELLSCARASASRDEIITLIRQIVPEYRVQP